MALETIRIFELLEKTAGAGNDVFPFYDTGGGLDKKMSFANLAFYILQTSNQNIDIENLLPSINLLDFGGDESAELTNATLTIDKTATGESATIARTGMTVAKTGNTDVTLTNTTGLVAAYYTSETSNVLMTSGGPTTTAVIQVKLYIKKPVTVGTRIVVNTSATQGTFGITPRLDGGTLGIEGYIHTGASSFLTGNITAPTTTRIGYLPLNPGRYQIEFSIIGAAGGTTQTYELYLLGAYGSNDLTDGSIFEIIP